MANYRPNVKGHAHPKSTRASSRKRNEKLPRAYWLDIGKAISLELTAAKHNFAVKGGSR